MKLLLTSNGLSNKSIFKAFSELVDKPVHTVCVAFIPTASNSEPGDKGWLISDLDNLRKQNFKSLDIVDISALPKKIWLSRLMASDVIVVGGGNTVHLLYWIRKTGLDKVLPKLLKDRIYVGISAGCIILAPTIELSSETEPSFKYDEPKYHSKIGLGFIDFHIRPHLDSPYFPKAKSDYVARRARKILERIYALDDYSAVKVDGKDINVVGKGKYIIFNK